MLSFCSEQSTSFDFGKSKCGSDWQIVNDGVMGGKSQSSAVLTDSSILFKGYISLENNGGFASLRGPFATMDLQNSKQIKIKYKSKGQLLSITLANSRLWYKPFGKFTLDSTGNEWRIAVVKLNNFKEFAYGSSTGKSIGKNFISTIKRVGFIVNNKIQGGFEIEVDYLKFN